MRRSERLAALALVVAAGVGSAPAWSAPDVLERFAAVLPLLQPDERARLQQRARIWSGWTADERRVHRERVTAWQALSAAERGERRERYLAWQALPPAERERVRLARDAFAGFAPERQRDLRLRFDQLDASVRRGWRLGPALGLDYPLLQPLLAQVPADEREPLLRTLRAMTPVQRVDLAALVQRTPPAGRDALRRELISTAAPQRDAWLRERLDR